VIVAQRAVGAIVVDPLSVGATDVSVGLSAPYSPVTNPVSDPYSLPAGSDGLLVVGRNAAGSFEVNGGSDAAVGQIWIANNVGSTGRITVRNPGSSLTSMYDIRVGQSGVGELEIVDGGEVLTEQVYVHSDVVGSPSRLTVSGAGTKLTATYGLFLGYGRHAIVTTSDGALIEASRAEIGLYETSVDSLAEATVTTGGKWILSDRLEVGVSGRGTLTVSDGGEVEAKTAVLNRYLSYPVPLTLAGGTLRADDLYFPNDGVDGIGSIFAKGVVSDLELRFDATHGLTQVLPLPGAPDVDLTLDHSQPAVLGVGYGALGTLTIADGRQITSTAGILGHSYNSFGQAFVQGAGSGWYIDGDLLVGRQGAGELTIGTGAEVNVGGQLMLGSTSGLYDSRLVLNGGSLHARSLAASSNQLLGVGTIHAGGLHLDGTIVFDQPGIGGGSVVLDDLPGQNVTIQFDHPELTLLGVGYRGTGLLSIRNGAKVRSLVGALGKAEGSRGTAVVEGAGSEWDVSGGELAIGSDSGFPRASGTLQVLSGGLVKSDSLRLIAASRLEVAGPDSRVEAGRIEFGYNNNDGVPLLHVHSGATVAVDEMYSSSGSGVSARITVEGPGSQLIVRTYTQIQSGVLRVSDGATMSFGEPGWGGGNLYLADGILDLDGGTVELFGADIQLQGSQILFEEGTLRGFRRLEGQLWQTSGRVELGSSQATITGSYYQDDDAVLQLTLQQEWTPARLIVNQTAILAGTLEVLASEDLPDHASIFSDYYRVIATNSGLVGEFTDYVLPELATGLDWSVVQTNNEMSLHIITGDYNQDGVVNAADYTLWRNSLGQQVEAGSGADGDRNGFIDEGDFSMWKDFFGRVVVGGVGAGRASTLGGTAAGDTEAVPEPTCGVLLIIGWMAHLAGGRARRASPRPWRGGAAPVD
jgi:T5SS/PEP-CTERM-associated repeat protein